MTEAGIAIGSIAYMSPEQALGDRDVDRRSDIYSLGCVLYEMLAGAPPFRGQSPPELVARTVSGPVPSVRAQRPDVPTPVDRIVARCLAKTPAERFQSAAEVREALSVAETGGRVSFADTVRWRRLRRAAVVTVPLIAAGVTVAALVAREADERDGAKAYTIVADVEGSAAPDVRRTVRSLVAGALEQATVLMPVSDARVRQGLASMRRSDTLPLDPSAARQVAYRGGVRTVVAPSLERVGQRYALTVRVQDAESGTVIATERATSDSEDGLIPAVDVVVRGLHRRLGVRGIDVRPVRDEFTYATTASFDAFQKWVGASELNRAGRFRQAAELAREAVALDSTFLQAWVSLVTVWGNIGERDSMLDAVTHVERHLHRGSEREQLRARHVIAVGRSDYLAMLASLDRLIREDGPRPGWLTTRGLAFSAMGRESEAEHSHRRAIASSQFGPAPIHIANLGISLVLLGRPEEARSTVDSLSRVCGLPCAESPVLGAVWDQQLAIALDEWARAESLVVQNHDPVGAASVRARRGELRAAWAILDSSARIGQAHPIGELLVTLVTGRRWVRPPPVARSHALHRQTWTGVWQAVAGDTTAARELSDSVRRALSGRFRGAAPEFIDAAIAARAGRWREVVDALGPVAAERETGRWQYDGWISGLPIRWLVATAYERLGQLDSATAMYERVLWPGGIHTVQLQWRGIPYSFVHQRLAGLYARMGRHDDATRHSEAFRTAFTNADPDLRHLIEEARAAVSQAAGPQRRQPLQSVPDESVSRALPSRVTPQESSDSQSPRERLLVTDFHISGADSSIGAPLGVATRSALAQSSAITIESSDAVAGALERMRRPRSSPVDLSLGRQIAVREGIRAVVGGHVVRMGDGFNVGLRLVSADSGRDLVAVYALTKSLEDVIPALDRLAPELRARIGESLKSVRASPPLPRVTTHSLQALRLYAEGNVEPDLHKAIALLTQAVQADTEFAEAWRKLAVVYSNLRVFNAARDSATARAYRYRLKLPEIERLRIEDWHHSRAGPRPDRAKRIAILEQLLTLGDSDFALINLAGALRQRRDFARAESLSAISVRRIPDGSLPYPNLAQVQIDQGKVREAEAMLRLGFSRLPRAWRVERSKIQLLYHRGDLDGYERALERVRGGPGLEKRRAATAELRDLALLRGRLRAWEQLRADARALDEAAGIAPSPITDALEAAAVDLRVRGDTASAVQLLQRTTREHAPERRQNLVVGALFAAAKRPDLARQSLSRFEAAADTTWRRVDAPWVHRSRAELALAEGRFAEAINEIRKGDAYPDGPAEACFICYYLSLGTTFDRANLPDSAIVMLERYVDMPFSERMEVDALNLGNTLRRLAELHESRGDRHRAIHYYSRFVDLWKSADGELQPRVDDVRRRIARLQRAR